MQFKLVCVLVALFAYQGLNVNATPTSETLDTRGLIESIQNGLNKLTEVIRAAINLAIDKIQDAYNLILSLVDLIVDGTMGKVAKAIKLVLDEIIRLKTAAIELGIDILECTQEPETKLHELPGVVLKELKGCIKVQTDKAEKIFTDGKANIENRINIIANLTIEFKQCGSNLLCLSGCLAKITAAAVRVPLEIANVGINVVDLLMSVKTDMALCGTAVIGDVAVLTADILKNVTACVDEKMKEKILLPIQ